MFGMQCFRFEPPKLEGIMKDRPCDFHVTEVNLFGKDADLCSVEQCVVSTSAVNTPKTLEENGPLKYSQHVPLADEDAEKLLPPKDSENVRSLTSILGEPVYQSVKSFAEKQKVRIRSSCNPAAADAESDILPLAVSLGTFHEKEQRTNLYAALKCSFPHLQAFLEEGREMKTSVDDKYLTFRALLSEEDSDNLSRFVSRKVVNAVLNLSSMPCKSQRTNVHKLINKYYGSLLESKTFTKVTDGVTRTWIQLRVKEKSRGQKRKLDASKCDASYTGFTLWKENLESLDAIQIIARALRVRPSDISYAGIKDKKAITTQFMAVNLPCHRVKKALKDLDERCVKVGNFQSRTRPIATGELWGNRFELIVRGVRLKQGDGDPAKLCMSSSLESNLKEYLVKRISRIKNDISPQKDGFINYFGKQRFGERCNTPIGSLTAEVGLAMLRKNYKQAVDLILSPDSDKDDSVNRAKRLFQETRDARAALKLMPHYKVRECAILKALNRFGIEQEGCCKAILGIPHGMRQLYVHSFTSLFWNQMVTQRIQDHGFCVLPGDLVATTKAGRVTKDEVKLLHAEDLSDPSEYDIKNVLLPLPGNMVKYPGHKTGEAYQRLLKSYGLESSQFRLNSLQLNIPGDYRRLIETPEEFQWKLFHELGNGSWCPVFDDQGQIETVDGHDSHDAEINTGHCQLNRKSELEAQNPTDGKETSAKALKKGKSHKCGNKIDHEANLKLEVSFKLPSATYATSVLRELLVSD